MPHFGAIEENNGLADECYKLMNCKRLLNWGKVSTLFCTATCTIVRERLRVMFCGK